MSQNNSSTIYCGLDIHKAALTLDLCGRQHELPQTAAGHRRLIALVQRLQAPHVICEASGGYERPVLAALHAAHVTLSLINPQRARALAQADSRHAKNDPKDAALLTYFGEKIQPAPTPPPDLVQQQLTELIRLRVQITEKLVAQRQQTEALVFVATRRISQDLVRHLEKDLARIDAQLAKLQKQNELLHRKVELLTETDGVGVLTARALLAELPECGRINRQRIAGLAGLAPYSQESGTWKGQRRIQGGRPAVRRILYMAALTAIRHNPVLKAFYQNLRQRGKLAKVALTAVMRKLLVHLNANLAPLCSP